MRADGGDHRALTESFFATLEGELIDRSAFRNAARRASLCSITSRSSTGTLESGY